MAGKKLPKDIDLTKKINAADGYFMNEPSGEYATGTYKSEKKAAGSTGGRPQKEGLKNEQFTLTMNPEMYEKLRTVAKEYCNGNFSRLIDEAVRLYCRENGIHLGDIAVAPEILDAYRKKQEKKNAVKIK